MEWHTRQQYMDCVMGLGVSACSNLFTNHAWLGSQYVALLRREDILTVAGRNVARHDGAMQHFKPSLSEVTVPAPIIH